MDSKSLKASIEYCIRESRDASTSLDTLHYSQAALNLSLAARNLPYQVSEIHMNDLSPYEIDKRIEAAAIRHGATTKEARKWLLTGFLACQEGYKQI